MKVDKFDYKRQKDLIIDTISDLKDDDKIETGNGFSRGYYKNDFEDIIIEINLLKKELLKQGLNLDKFMKDFKDEVYNDYNIADSAFMDSLLYYYDKKEGILSGIKMSDQNVEEFYFKYKYGYHTYDMGRRFLLQSYNDLNEYYEDTANKLIYSYLTAIWGCDKEDADKCYVIKKYGNGYTIYAHLGIMQSFTNSSLDDFKNEIIKDFIDTKYKIIDDILQLFVGYNYHAVSQKELDEIADKLELRYNAEKYNIG